MVPHVKVLGSRCLPCGRASPQAIRGGKSAYFDGEAPPATIGELSMLYNQMSNHAVNVLMAAAKTNSNLHRVDVDHQLMVHGETLDALKTDHNPAMKERFDVATWIVDSELIDGGFHGEEGPVLGTDFAPAVTELQVHKQEGLEALRHHSEEDLSKIPVVAALDPEKRKAFVKLVLDKVAAATAHDEL
jgi:hypothetical protein